MSILKNYQSVFTSIHKVAEQSGRDPSEISLVAVSKGHSIESILSLYAAGCLHFGENKLQEIFDKQALAPEEIRWHYIGSLQKNKVRKIIGKFYLIHSIDSQELAAKISQCSLEAGVVTSVLLQVNTSGETTKHGFTPSGVIESIHDLVDMKGLNIKGLMTMAPLTLDDGIIRASFKDLRETRDLLQALVGEKAHLTELSMGMSHDYKIAIEEGATLLRLGTAIFGE